MKTLSILTAAAGILLAISGPSLAASRTPAHKAAGAYSAYAHDPESAFWHAPHVYAPNALARAPAYAVPDRNVGNAFVPDRDWYSRGPVGTIRNDW
jgi:hypothetical protein